MNDRSISRRRFIGQALGAGGAVACGCATTARPRLGPEAFAHGTRVGTIPLETASTAPVDTPIGDGLDGRLYTDLSRLTEDALVTPSERFFVRTRASELLPEAESWVIEVAGLVEQPARVRLAELVHAAAPMGTTLFECSGNASLTHFGLIGAAHWSGVPLERVLARVTPRPEAMRVKVSGFDRYPGASQTSNAGASWVFSREDLAGAFLATGMNGAPLPRDHGAPVRLVVPGWYGCTCTKWVDRIELVADDEPSTPQMREFATRTEQEGVPDLARDFSPAVMDTAAMPVRVEVWRVGGERVHRVVGIVWGAAAPAAALEIRFRRDLPWQRVDVPPRHREASTWALWSHAWQPTEPGRYLIRLRVSDRGVRTRRLDRGYYARSVLIEDV